MTASTQPVVTEKRPPRRFSRPVAPRLMEGCCPEPNTGCWLWILNRDRKGYGRIAVKGHKRLAHRESYRLFKGDPTGLFVCHKCDTPACINPDHLFLGTSKDNQIDCARKGRNTMQKYPRISRLCRLESHLRPKGEKASGAKLKESDVLAIRSSGLSTKQLASDFSVSICQISAIKRGIYWKHLIANTAQGKF